MEECIKQLDNVMEGFRKAEFAELDDIEDLYQKFDYEDYIAVENLIKGYRELEEKINKLEILKTKLLKEFECANEGFMKKQIPTSVVDGTIVQEIGWILQEIDDILQEGDDK